jgi:hypothetical protein
MVRGYAPRRHREPTTEGHTRRRVTSPTCTSATPTTRKTHHRAHRLPAKCRRRSPANPSQKQSTTLWILNAIICHGLRM